MSEGDGSDDDVKQDKLPSLPTAEEVKKELDSTPARKRKRRREENIFEKELSTDSAERQTDYEHAKGLADHYRHKRYWSWFIIGLMSWMILFQSGTIFMVGFNWWDFTKYEWLLPSLLVQNLAQLVGLAVIVVRSLFSGKE